MKQVPIPIDDLREIVGVLERDTNPRTLNLFVRTSNALHEAWSAELTEEAERQARVELDRDPTPDMFEKEFRK